MLRRMEHFKTEHYILVREAMTILNLAVWKAMIDMNQDEDDSSQRAERAKKVKMDMKAMRRERTCHIWCRYCGEECPPLPPVGVIFGPMII